VLRLSGKPWNNITRRQCGDKYALWYFNLDNISL